MQALRLALALVLSAWVPTTAVALAVFDVTQYGAVGDGKTYDTAAVRKAAAAVTAASVLPEAYSACLCPTVILWYQTSLLRPSHSLLQCL